MAQKKAPTAKQVKLAESIATNPLQAQSEHCRAAGYRETIAGHQARRTIETEGTQEALKKFLPLTQVDDQRLADKLSGLLDATKLVGKEGRETDDNAVQFATAELFLKLKGYLRDEKDVQRVVVVVANEFMPIMSPFVDENKRGEFMAALEAFRATSQGY